MKTLDLNGQKAQQIMSGARSAFFELGYEGASTEEIVRRAKVSKGTLYNYFPDKQSLFKAIIERESKAYADNVLQASDVDGAIDEVLRHLAQQLAQLLVSSQAIDMYRLAVGEAQRFPHLAQSFYESGPKNGIAQLIAVFKKAQKRGELSIDDYDLAASQFEQLCKAGLFYERAFMMRSHVASEEINRVATGAVRTFLRAYGT